MTFLKIPKPYSTITILLIIIIVVCIAILFATNKLDNEIAQYVEETSFSIAAASLAPKKKVVLESARIVIHQFMQPPFFWPPPAIKIVSIDLSYPCHSRYPDSDGFMVEVGYYFKPSYAYFACV